MTDTEPTTEPTEQPTVKAVFDTSSIDAAAAQQIADAIERVRPLDRDQKDNLLDILREDSHAIGVQVSQAFSNARHVKKQEVLEQFPEPESQVQRFRIEAEELLKVQAREFKKLIKRAKKEGVQMSNVHSPYGKGAGSLTGTLHVTQDHDRSERDKALTEALAPIDAAERAALDAIQTARGEASRKIRLASVSKDASDILGSLPDPATLIGKIEEAVTAATADIEAAKPRRILSRRTR